MAKRLASLIVLCAVALAAGAQDCTAWLNASDGNDTNPGTQTLPLRSFEFAFESLPQGAVVCTAAGEYFYGEDADGVHLEEADKSMTFVLEQFAGLTEIRFSESEFILDIGSGIVSVLNQSATALVMGSGLVNIDDPMDPGLLNFVHTVAFLSGRLDVTGVTLTLEPSVGNPDWTHPTNSLKTPPTDARIEFSDGVAPTDITYEPGHRSLLVNPQTDGGGGMLAILPTNLSDTDLTFVGPGTALFNGDLTLSDGMVEFRHSGEVRFSGAIRVDMTRESIDVGNGFTGTITFENELILFASGADAASWRLNGTGNVSAAVMQSEGTRPIEPDLMFEWGSSGDLNIDSISKTSIGGNMEPALGVSVLSGRFLIGDGATAQVMPGSLSVAGEMIFGANISLASSPAPLTNTGVIDLSSHQLTTGSLTDDIINNGSITGSSGALMVVSGDASLRGGGAITIPVEITAPFELGSHNVLAAISVLNGGVLTISASSSVSALGIELMSGSSLSMAQSTTLTLLGGLAARSGSALVFATGSLLSQNGNLLIEDSVTGSSDGGIIELSGNTPGISIATGAVSPDLSIVGGAATFTGGSELPGVAINGGSLTIDVGGDFQCGGDMNIESGTLSLSTPGEVTFLGSLTLSSGSVASIDASTFRPGGDLSITSSELDLNSSVVHPIDGSTVELYSDAVVVLPSLLLADSDANLLITGLFTIPGDVLLSSGELIIESSGVLTINGDISRTSGIFEPVDGGTLVLAGAQSQSLSGFSSSVLPSIVVSGAGAEIGENTVVLGSLELLAGIMTISGGSTLSVSNDLLLSGGTFSASAGSEVTLGGDWRMSSGMFEMLGGNLSIAGDGLISGGIIQAPSTGVFFDGSSQQRASFEIETLFRHLELESDVELIVDAGAMSISERIIVSTGASLDLVGASILLGSGQPTAAIKNKGSIQSSDGWIDLAGDATFSLSGMGQFGALKVNLSDDEALVEVAQGNGGFRVSDDILFLSGSIDLRGNSLEFSGGVQIPEVTLNLSDLINSPGAPDGRGFVDTISELSVVAGSSYDLAYTGSITTLHLVSEEFQDGFVRNLLVEAMDPVNVPPIFGVRSGESRSISGALNVAAGSLLRLDEESFALPGDAVSHFVNGTISGDGILRLEGSGSPLLSTVEGGSRIENLEIEVQSTTTASVISGITDFDSVRILGGSVRWSGIPARISEEFAIEGGEVALQTSLQVLSGARLTGENAVLSLEQGSLVTFLDNTEISLASSLEIDVGAGARSADSRSDGFIVLAGSATIGATAGIPRLLISADSEIASSDNVFLSSNLIVTEWFEIENGDLFVGEYDLEFLGGSVILDSDSDPFDGDGDNISGDFSGQLGRLIISGETTVTLGNDTNLQSIDLLIDAGGGTVSLASTTSQPHSLILSNRPFLLRSGEFNLGLQDLVLNGSIEQVLLIEGGSIKAQSLQSVLPGSMPPLQTGRYAPFIDADVGEIVLTGGGNASILALSETTIPHLRLSGNVRLEASSSPVVVSNRFVFAEQGASLIIDLADGLRFSDGAVLIRRGRGTLSAQPIFQGSADVFYELDDGDVTGNDTGFLQGDLVTGFEIPSITGQLGVLSVLAGNSGSTINRVKLATDIIVSEALVIHSGDLDLNAHQLTLTDGSLLAVDQIDAASPGQIIGSGLMSPGAINLGVAARHTNIDLSPPLIGTLSVDRARLYIGMSQSSIPRTIRLGGTLQADTVSVSGSENGDSFRMDGHDLVASGSLSLEDIEMSSSQVASIQTGGFMLDAGSSLTGPIEVVVSGNAQIDGEFKGLVLEIASDLGVSQTLGSNTLLRFTGISQVWSVSQPLEISTLAIEQVETPGARVDLQSTNGTVEISITDELVLDSGLLVLNGHSLLLAGSETGFSRSPNPGVVSHVVGQIVRNADENSTESFVFPVGSSTDYRPFYFSFSSPLLSASRLGIEHVTGQYSSRTGLPLTASDGALIVDAAPFSWIMSSSVNFAQSQPATIAAEIPESIVGTGELYRLLSRGAQDLSEAWTVVGGTPVATITSSNIILRNIDARGLFTPEGVEIGVGLPENIYSDDTDIQYVNLSDLVGVRFVSEDRVQFRASMASAASGLVTRGFDPDQPTSIGFEVESVVDGMNLGSNDLDLAASGRHVQALVGSAGMGYDLINFDLEGESAASSGRVGVWFAHANPVLPDIDLSMGVILPVLLGSDITYMDHTESFSAVAGPITFRIDLDSGEAEVFAFDLSPFDGSSGVLLLTNPSAGSDISFGLSFLAEDGGILTGLVVTGLDPTTAEIPSSLLLKGNYPNPFNPVTNIVFDLPEAADVRLQVFDVLGRIVNSAEVGFLGAGRDNLMRFDGSRLASGTYFYVITARSGRRVRRKSGSMLLMK